MVRRVRSVRRPGEPQRTFLVKCLGEGCELEVEDSRYGFCRECFASRRARSAKRLIERLNLDDPGTERGRRALLRELDKPQPKPTKFDESPGPW